MEGKLEWLLLMKLITEICRLKHIRTFLCVTYYPLTDGFQLTPLLSVLGLFHNIMWYLLLCKYRLLLSPWCRLEELFIGFTQATSCVEDSWNYYCLSLWLSFRFLKQRQATSVSSRICSTHKHVTFIFPVLLRNNWPASLYKFKAYNKVVWFMLIVKWLQ